MFDTLFIFEFVYLFRHNISVQLVSVSCLDSTINAAQSPGKVEVLITIDNKICTINNINRAYDIHFTNVRCKTINENI